MGHVKTIARNSLWSLTDSLLGMVSSLGCSIAVARAMGPARLGYYSYVLWLAGMAGSIATFGIPSATRRFAAEAFGRGDLGVARAIVRATFRIQLYMGIVAVAIGLFVVFRYVPHEHQSYALLAVISIMPLLLYSIPTAAIAATEDLAPNVRASIVSTFVIGGGTAVALLLGWGLPGLAGAMLAARTVDFVMRQYYYLRIYSRFPVTTAKDHLPPELKQKIIQFCWQATIITALEIVVWDRSEMFFLQRYSTIVQVAFYSMSFNFSQYLLLLPRVASSAAGATIAVEHGRDPSKTSYLAVGTMRVLAIVTIPSAFGLAALTDPLIRLLYGAQYVPAILPFTLLAMLTLGKALQLPARQLLGSTDRQAALVKWGCVLAVVNIAADLILIRRYGALGAAVAKGAVQMIGAVSIWWIVAVAFRTRLPLSRLLRITAAAAVMFVAVRALSMALPPLAALLIGPPLGIAIIVVLFRVFHCLEPQDREPLRALERRSPGPLKRPIGALFGFLFPRPPIVVPIVPGQSV
jgi:O-antigen/teichoic acid export membrane protein